MPRQDNSVLTAGAGVSDGGDSCVETQTQVETNVCVKDEVSETTDGV